MCSRGSPCFTRNSPPPHPPRQPGARALEAQWPPKVTRLDLAQGRCPSASVPPCVLHVPSTATVRVHRGKSWDPSGSVCTCCVWVSTRAWSSSVCWGLVCCALGGCASAPAVSFSWGDCRLPRLVPLHGVVPSPHTRRGCTRAPGSPARPGRAVTTRSRWADVDLPGVASEEVAAASSRSPEGSPGGQWGGMVEGPVPRPAGAERPSG